MGVSEVLLCPYRCLKYTRKLCYRKDDRAMRAIYVDREPLRRYTTGCGDMAI